MKYGKLFLIPSFIGDNLPGDVLPQKTMDTACSLDCFVVEETRTARRFLSSIGMKGRLEGVEFHELNEHTPDEAVEGYRQTKNPLILFICVSVFILSGFEHCVANMFYFFLAGMWSLKAVGYLLIMTVGNSLGGMLIPAVKKLEIVGK